MVQGCHFPAKPAFSQPFLVFPAFSQPFCFPSLFPAFFKNMAFDMNLSYLQEDFAFLQQIHPCWLLKKYFFALKWKNLIKFYHSKRWKRIFFHVKFQLFWFFSAILSAFWGIVVWQLCINLIAIINILLVGTNYT